MMRLNRDLIDAKRNHPEDLEHAKKVLRDIAENANIMWLGLLPEDPISPLDAINTPDAIAPVTTEEAVDSQESDGSSWDRVFEAFRSREGYYCLMTYLGGPNGGYATDDTDRLWKWREERGQRRVFTLLLGKRVVFRPR